MVTITTLSLMNKCLNWKNELLVLFPFVIVQTIGYQIQDQNNQVHNLVQVRNLHQILNQLQAIQLMRNWSKKLFEK
ncbi:Uncharacterised protein [Streptococcus pneumoniae]|nr:Uncharacterised protein [Streptococcus pneumoniae]